MPPDNGMNPVEWYCLLLSVIVAVPSAYRVVAFQTDAPAEDRYVLEAPTKFSESLLWRLQKSFYDHAGVDAVCNAASLDTHTPSCTL